MTDEELNNYCLDLMTNDPSKLVVLSLSDEVEHNERLKSIVGQYIRTLND